MVDTSNAKSAYHDHEVLKPKSVVSYNKSKAGVDKHDQMASYYPFKRKSVKWWKKVFFWLFQLGIVNAHKYYKLSNPSSKMSLAKYIQNIAHGLSSVKEDVQTPPTASEPRRNVVGNHFPLRIPPTNNKMKPTHCCRLCSTRTDSKGKKIRRETSWLCEECNVPLCVECFKPYHCPRSQPT
jgi:hypothetical protein